MTDTHQGFSVVDEADDPGDLVAYLDTTDRHPLIARMRALIADALAVQPGQSVLDVGCGTGTVLFELAAQAAPNGRAVGVDLSEEMLAVAERRRPATVELERADAASLPFPDASFDRYRAERVYQHLADPRPALDEAMRVLRSGGRLVLCDPDWEGLLVDVDDVPTLRRAVDAFAAARPSMSVGRRFRRLLLESGFVDVHVEGMVAVLTDLPLAARLALDVIVFSGAARQAVPPEALERLRAAMQERAERGTFLMSFPVFVASATRP